MLKKGERKTFRLMVKLLFERLNRLIDYNYEEVRIILSRYFLTSAPSNGVELILTPQYAYEHYNLTGSEKGYYLPNEDKIVIFLFNVDRLSTTLVHECVHYLLHRFKIIDRILSEVSEELSHVLYHMYKIPREETIIEVLTNARLIEEAIVHLVEIEYYTHEVRYNNYYTYVTMLIDRIRTLNKNVDPDEAYNIIMQIIWDKVWKLGNIIRNCIKKPPQSPLLLTSNNVNIFMLVYTYYLRTITGEVIPDFIGFAHELCENVPDLQDHAIYIKVLTHE